MKSQYLFLGACALTLVCSIDMQAAQKRGRDENGNSSQRSVSPSPKRQKTEDSSNSSSSSSSSGQQQTSALQDLFRERRARLAPGYQQQRLEEAQREKEQAQVAIAQQEEKRVRQEQAQIQKEHEERVAQEVAAGKAEKANKLDEIKNLIDDAAKNIREAATLVDVLQELQTLEDLIKSYELVGLNLVTIDTESEECMKCKTAILATLNQLVMEISGNNNKFAVDNFFDNVNRAQTDNVFQEINKILAMFGCQPIAYERVYKGQNSAHANQEDFEYVRQLQEQEQQREARARADRAQALAFDQQERQRQARVEADLALAQRIANGGPLVGQAQQPLQPQSVGGLTDEEFESLLQFLD